jgi:hypothetical protein
MKCQFDAFAEYVAEAEKRGTKNYPLYAWTKSTIENPEKRAKYLKSFTLYVDGNEVYAKPGGCDRIRLAAFGQRQADHASFQVRHESGEQPAGASAVSQLGKGGGEGHPLFFEEFRWKTIRKG